MADSEYIVDCTIDGCLDWSFRIYANNMISAKHKAYRIHHHDDRSKFDYLMLTET